MALNSMTLSVVSNPREEWLSHLVTAGIISTPSLVVDTDEIGRVLTFFETYLPEAKLFYAVKANNAPGIIKFLAEKGLSFDVASDNEIMEVRAAGVPASRMILSNPIKTTHTINTFFDEGLRFCVIDNPHDLEMLHKARGRCQSDREVPGIFVRLRIPTTDVQIDLNQKFGATEDEAVALLASAARLGFQARGVQFHVGTQSWNSSNYKIGIASALRVIDGTQRLGIACDSINIGGGFPDPLVARESGGLENFFSHLREAITPAIIRGLNIIAEPGRVMVSGACSAVCTVIGKSIRNGIPWLYLDDGAYGLFSGKFFDHKEFHLRVLTQRDTSAGAKMTPYVVAGPTCDSLDIICQTTLLPSHVEPGDVLCAHNMGAYSLVTASMFNGFGRIKVYVDQSSSFAKKSTRGVVVPYYPVRKLADGH